ncbi:MAG: hypothetical protein WCC27_11180, partial [Acidobacteriaceae bacterium]
MAETPSKGDRVDGWKGIADYLGRDVTTVIRWAKIHGLPVNRGPAGSPRRAVFALKSEIDAWVAGRGSSNLPADEDASASRQPNTQSPRWRKPLLYAAAAAVVTLLTWAAWRFAETRLSVHAPRFAELQSSGQGPVIFRGSFECVACSPDSSWLASGFADQLASDLIRIPGVHVRALAAAPAPSAPEPVKLLLTARVARQEGSRIAVTIFLSNSDSHEQLWSRHYETLATGLPVLEFDIANDIFRYLQPYLPARDTTPFKAVWTRDPVAYE